MIFLNPILAAVGLACIAAPILIHILMRRRRRPVAWGAMKFLLEAYRRQRRRMNLEQILLLAARCLLVALVALAVGKPLLSGGTGVAAGTARTVHLVIDQSIAGSAETDGRTAIESLRERALALVDDLDPSRGDRIAIYSAAAPAAALISPPSADIASARSILRDLRALDSRADIPGAIALIAESLGAQSDEDTTQPIIAVFSEFRAGSMDTQRAIEPVVIGDAGVRIAATPPASTDLTNIGVASIEPLRTVVIGGADGGQIEPIPVRITLRRSGESVRSAGEASATVGADLAGGAGAGALASARVVFAQGQETASALALVQPRSAPPAGGALVLSATVAGDALAADNTARSPVEFRRRLEVAIIAGDTAARPGAIETFSAADWFTLALTPRADTLSFRRTATDMRITRLDPRRDIEGAGALASFDAAIVTRPDQVSPAGWEQLADAADRGALVMVVPPAEIETHLWTDAMTQAFEVGWTFEREAAAIEGGAEISADRSAFADDPLTLIGPELAELVRPVRVQRILPMTQSGQTASQPGGQSGGRNEDPNVDPNGRPAAGATVGEPWLRLADGRPLVIAASPERGRGALVLLTTSPALSWSDIATKPLMVPLAQELVRQGVGRAVGARQATAGATPVLPESAVELTSISESSEIVRLVRTGAGAMPETAMQRAGLWAARSADGRTLATIAINPDTAGARVEVAGAEEVASWLGNAGGQVEWISDDDAPAAAEGGPVFDLRRADDAPTLSVPLLAAALAVALLELILAKVFSHARVESAPAAAAAGRDAA